LSQESRDVVADRYRIISELGAGHYGIVYRAHDITLQKDVALKMLNVGDTNPTAVLRFQKEARAAAKLKHTNIVTVLDFRLDEKNNFYLVLELIEGMSLREIIARRKQIPPEECLHLFLQILNGLTHAHASGVIHRDLNPNNILVDFRNPNDPLAKIVDFGLAWLTDEDQRLTREGVAVGTPEYISPEQCHGSETDARADIYSFGCVMFDALTGQPPYTDDTTVNIIMSHINKDAPLISDVRPDIAFPKMLVDIVHKALKRNADERFQSADELAYALRSVQVEAEGHPELFDEVPTKEAEHAQPQAVAGPLAWMPRSVQIGFVAVVLLAVSVLLLFLRVSETPNDAPESQPAQKKGTSVGPANMANVPSELVLSQITGGDEGAALRIAHMNTISKSGKIWDASSNNDKQLAIVKGRYDITWLRLKVAFDLQGPGLANLEGLPLRDLEIIHAPLTDEALAKYLPELPQLSQLSLHTCDNIKGTQLEKVSAKCPQLKWLLLNSSPITDAGLKQVPSFSNLDYLNISHCHSLKGTGLAALTKLSGLVELNLEDTNMDPASLKQLAGCPRLRNIVLSKTKFNAGDIEFLQKLNLDALYLANTTVDDQCLKVVAKCKNLRFLSLRGARGFTKDGLKAVGGSVKNLDFSDQEMTDGYVESLKSWKNLTNIKLARTVISRAQIERLLTNNSKLVSIVVDPVVLGEDIELVKAKFRDREFKVANK